MVKQFSRVDSCRTCIFDTKKIFLLHVSLQSKMTKYPLDVMRETNSCLLEVWRAQVGCLLRPHRNHTVLPACSTCLLQAFLPWSRGNFSPFLSHGPTSPEPGARGSDTHLEFSLVGASFCVSCVLIQGRLSMLE